MIKNNSAKKWQSRCFQYTTGGFYYTKPCFKGRRETLCCGTNILAQAAAVARDIFMKLRAKGWDAVLAEYAPNAIQALKVPVTMSVGDYCARAKAVYGGCPRTIDDYIRAFKRIVADIYQIERGAEKYDYATGGRAEWLSRVNKIDITALSRARIEEWRVSFIAPPSTGDLDKLRAAKTSANTLLRMCKSLFSAERMEQLGASEIQNPFAKIKLDSAGDMRFKRRVDAQTLAKAAFAELDTESLKAFVLSLSCGLRRNESDKLEWSAFDFGRGTVHVGPTQHLHVKSEKSVGDVDLDESTLAFFRGHYAKRSNEFVLESAIEPRPQAGYSHYRCAGTFERLGTWLRAHGLKSRTPIHTLRKMFGSLVCDQYGIHAASQSLRHSDIAITSKHYVAKRAKVTVSLDALKVPPAAEKIVEFPKEQATG